MGIRAVYRWHNKIYCSSLLTIRAAYLNGLCTKKSIKQANYHRNLNGNFGLPSIEVLGAIRVVVTTGVCFRGICISRTLGELVKPVPSFTIIDHRIVLRSLEGLAICFFRAMCRLGEANWGPSRFVIPGDLIITVVDDP